MSYKYLFILIFFQAVYADVQQDLFDAVEARDIRGIAQALDAGADPNQFYGSGKFPLLFAAHAGHFDSVKLLLEHGADPNLKIFLSFEQTPLIMAAWRGYYDIVELLLAFGADPNVIGGREEETALYYAVDKKHVDIVQLLLKNLADPNSALARAIALRNHDLVRMLLEYGADPNMKNRWGETPIMVAAATGYIALVKLLIQFKALLHYKTPRNETALTFAIKEMHNIHNQRDMVKFLLESGIEVIKNDIKAAAKFYKSELDAQLYDQQFHDNSDFITTLDLVLKYVTLKKS